MAFRAGLRALGQVEGQTMVIEFRWAATVDEMPALATELVHMPVDIIVAPSSTHVEAARRATQTIPIVFATHADPVGVGHVASLARPGGNITGVSMALTEMAVKELEILNKALPRAALIGVLWNPTTPSHSYVVPAVQAAGKTLGIQLLLAPVTKLEDFEPTLSMMVRERVDGFLVVSSPLATSHAAPLAALARKYRLPGMFATKPTAEAGGLMSYGADMNYLFRRAATYVDKILKGTRPSDLPVEQPTKFELTINLKTAKELGVRIAPSLLLQADTVIE